MKTKFLKQIIAIVIAGTFSVFYVQSQTALSGTAAASNSCGTTAGTGGGGTTNTNVGCGAGSATTSSGTNNVSLGVNAFTTNQNGDDNVMLGREAGYNIYNSNNCVFVGSMAGRANSNTENLADNNIFIGFKSGYTNTDGGNNVFVGTLAGTLNTASNNTFLGHRSGYNNSSATGNSFIGYYSGNANTTGGYNTFMGYTSGQVNTTGQKNHFLGTYSGYANTTGSYNTFDGYNTGASNVSGTYNCFLGYNAGYYSTGDFNTYIGRQAGYNATGTATDYNTYVGHFAGYTSTADIQNTAVGSDALYTNNGGNYCTAVGVNAGAANTTGDNNTYLGYGATANAGTYSNSMALGNGATVTATDMVYIGNSSAKLYCNLGVWTGSDGRFKFNVQENVSGLDFIKRLRPVTYQVNTQQHHDFVRQNVIEPNLTDSLGESGPSDNTEFSASTSVIHAGFIAQEVEVAAAESGFVSSIVSPPANESSTYAVNYSEIVVPLVKAVQEQQDSIHNLTQRLAQLENIVNNCCNAPSGRSMGIIPTNTTQVVELNYADNVILYQNTPNPFGDETVISYYLPQSVKSAKMDFFDNTGKMIKEITIDQRGNASVTIKSADLSIGIYAYSLIVDGKGIDTKKMIKNK